MSEDTQEPLTLAVESVLAAAIVGSPDEEIFIPNEAIEKDLTGKVISINYDMQRLGYVLRVEEA